MPDQTATSASPRLRLPGRWTLPGRLTWLVWVVAALLGLSSASALAASKGHRKRAKVVRKQLEPRRSVVVLGDTDADLRNSDGRGQWARTSPAGRLAVTSDWPPRLGGSAIGGSMAIADAHSPGGLRCDLCVASAASAEPGVASIPSLDLRAITNRLTTLQIRDTTVKLTSLSPFGLLVRKPF